MSYDPLAACEDQHQAAFDAPPPTDEEREDVFRMVSRVWVAPVSGGCALPGCNGVLDSYREEWLNPANGATWHHQAQICRTCGRRCVVI